MVVTYKCPSCGAAMEYDGQSGKLACASCGTQLTVEEYKQRQEATAVDEDFDFDGTPLGEDTYTHAEHAEGPTIQVQIFKCPSCG